MKAINEDVFKYLINISPKYWSKSRSIPNPKCDTLVNNMSKAFNFFMISARAKPIVIMVEEIRVYMMERSEKNWQKIVRYEGSILSNIKKDLRGSHHTLTNGLPGNLFGPLIMLSDFNLVPYI